jgi:hypothetical protein
MNFNQAVYAGILGLLLACVLYYTRSILAPVLGHFINNGIAAVTLHIEPYQAWHESLSETPLTFLLVMGIASLVTLPIMLLCIIKLKKYHADTEPEKEPAIESETEDGQAPARPKVYTWAFWAVLAIFMVSALIIEISSYIDVDNGHSFSGIITEDGYMVGVRTEITGNDEERFITVSGLSDPAVEESLNEELYIFSTWGVGIPYEDNIVTEVYGFEYAVVGDYLSVCRLDMVLWDGAEHPALYLRTQIYNLAAGEQAGSLSDFIDLGKDLLDLIEDGVFTQVYPGEIDGANERLIAEILNKHGQGAYFDTSFYLTQTSFGLYIDGDVEGEKGYWAFEAPYEDIRLILKENLLAVINE